MEEEEKKNKGEHDEEVKWKVGLWSRGVKERGASSREGFLRTAVRRGHGPLMEDVCLMMVKSVMLDRYRDKKMERYYGAAGVTVREEGSETDSSLTTLALRPC